MKKFISRVRFFEKVLKFKMLRFDPQVTDSFVKLSLVKFAFVLGTITQTRAPKKWKVLGLNGTVKYYNFLKVGRLWGIFILSNGRMIKQPGLKFSGLHISILLCDCWTYDDNIGPKIKDKYSTAFHFRESIYRIVNSHIRCYKATIHKSCIKRLKS